MIASEKSAERCRTSPLFDIVEQRAKKGFSDESLRKAELILSFPSRQKGMKEVDKWKYSPNFQDDYRLPTPLDLAAQNQDKDLCLLFFKYGGNPFKASQKIDAGGTTLHLTAFHYANGAFSKADQRFEQYGWLLDSWKQFEAEQTKKL